MPMSLDSVADLAEFTVMWNPQSAAHYHDIIKKEQMEEAYPTAQSIVDHLLGKDDEEA